MVRLYSVAIFCTSLALIIFLNQAERHDWCFFLFCSNVLHYDCIIGRINWEVHLIFNYLYLKYIFTIIHHLSPCVVVDLCVYVMLCV